MVFKVSARTVLELGAELISSDAIAIYELVKNAVDAGSPSGIEVHFYVTLGHTAYVECLAEIDSADFDVESARARILARHEKTAAPKMLRTLRQSLEGPTTLTGLRKALKQAYESTNWIEFRDTGNGMSRKDLVERYLVLGTPSRRVEIDAAQEAVETSKSRKADVPYLGEKGVGRLSVMRLGTMVQIQTATKSDRRLNVLEVDWERFADLSLSIEDIEIVPSVGSSKPDSDWSGTTIRVSNLTGRWSRRRVDDLAQYDLARFVDPFSKKRRFRIATFFNEERVEIPRMEGALLEAAHASVKAKYVPGKADPKLFIELQVRDADGKRHTKSLSLQRTDLWPIVNDPDEAIPSTVLETVGPFEAEAYWYNRRLLTSIESIGDQKAVRVLQKRWAGVMLFRDEYRVSPYGNEGDDWLGLDRRALASPGYKLNKLQFVGRVRISRLLNSRLRDQTSREGLQDCAEKFVFVELLRYLIQDLLRGFMDAGEQQQRHVDADLPELEERITSLEGRAKRAIRELSKKHHESSAEFRDVLALFREMKAYFDQARALADQAQDERTRLIQLAGVGLMLEVVAHELARSTEHALSLLGDTDAEDLPQHLSAPLRTLRREMQMMNKRLRVLDPLSISARQRRETFDLVSLVRDSFAAHQAQFERHRIAARVSISDGSDRALITGVRGMFVQILENLISNSVFWLTARQKDEKTFRPKIDVTIDGAEVVLRFTDNGSGIEPSLREEIFRPFFSTKNRKQRQGLGLYIARECATYNGARIYLSEERTEHKNRLNTFVLELKADES